MDKFYALSAPIRREIIALLSEGEKLTATAIAEKFQISAPAVSQHLKVLLNSELVQMHKQAQQRIYELNPLKILELESWAHKITTQLENVSKLIDDQTTEQNPQEASS